jgi:hypothetical protein
MGSFLRRSRQFVVERRVTQFYGAVSALECIAMADTQNFLDNLKNLRMVMSVALEHVQENRNQFVKNATSSDVGQFEQLVSQLRTLAEQLEKEFNTLEYLIGKHAS